MTAILTEPQAAKKIPKIGYVLRRYPRFSETFIANEIFALEQKGVDIAIYAMLKPDDGTFHKVVAKVRARAHYQLEKERKLRDQACAILCEISEHAPDRLIEAQQYVWRHPDLSDHDLYAAACLLGWARRFEIDHIHVHFGSAAALLAMLCHMMGGPTYTVTLHAYDIYRDDVDQSMLADKIEHAAGIVTVSEYNRSYLKQGVAAEHAEKLQVIYNGVDLEEFCYQSDNREEALVFAVGRLIEKKGFIHLIRAVALLRNRGTIMKCVIAGDGVEAANLQREIDSLALGDQVRLAGMMKQSQVRDYLQRATCFALPCVEARDGNIDALPTVLLESLACGCPSVSTHLSGIPEIIEDEVSGLLVEPGHESALAEAMQRVVSDTALRERLSMEGRRRVDLRFNSAANTSQLCDVFEKIIGNAVSSQAITRSSSFDAKVSS